MSSQTPSLAARAWANATGNQPKDFHLISPTIQRFYEAACGYVERDVLARQPPAAPTVYRTSERPPGKADGDLDSRDCVLAWFPDFGGYYRAHWKEVAARPGSFPQWQKMPPPPVHPTDAAFAAACFRLGLLTTDATRSLWNDGRTYAAQHKPA